MKTLIALTCCFIGVATYLLSRPQYVVSSSNNGLVSLEVKRAMKKMGPLKTYRLHPPKEGGRLEVLVEGKWLRLRY